MKAVSLVADPEAGGQTGAMALVAAVVVVEAVEVLVLGAELEEELLLETKYMAVSAISAPTTM